MSARILLAEQNDTIRGVAETILRQNGYEVISVNSAHKLFEIIEFSIPDLFIIDARLQVNGDQFCYERVRIDSRTAGTPLILMADAYDPSLALSTEKVIVRPFDPQDLIGRVSQAVKRQAQTDPITDPLAHAELSDDFLDAALGLDDIEVTDSEDMSKTEHNRRLRDDGDTKIVGVGQFTKDSNDPNDSSRVESLMIRDEDSDIKTTNPKEPAAIMNESASIEIMSDQYGLKDLKAHGSDFDAEDHDYAWFVNSMQGDHLDSRKVASSSTESDELSISSTAGMIDPVTPGPLRSARPPSSATPAAFQPHHADGGMDHFIDEFRQEVERLNDGSPDSIVIMDEQAPCYDPSPQQVTVAERVAAAPEKTTWQDEIENITPEHMKLFTRDVATRLADKIAALILARIDQDKLLHLIKDEIIAQTRKKE